MLRIFVLSILMSLQQHHVTMTSIDHKPGTDSLKVFINLKYDLLLKDYHQTVDDDIDISEFARAGYLPAEMATNYINRKVLIYANGKLLPGKILRMERSDENVLLNILYLPGTRLKTFKVRNSILTGLYSNIENLTIIRIGDFEKGVKFTQQHTEETFLIR